MDKARAQELLANERGRLERLLKAEIAATAPDQGDEVDDANWRIAEETGRAVSRSLRDRWSALERAEERLQRGTYGRSISSGKPIPDERLEADPLAELLVEEAAAEAFRARHSTETVSGLTSTRRTLAALADREDGTEDSRRQVAARAAAGPEAEEEEEAVVESPDDSADLDVEELDDSELIDEDEAPADFEEDDEAEDEASSDEHDEPEEEKQEEEKKESRPQPRRSGRR